MWTLWRVLPFGSLSKATIRQATRSTFLILHKDPDDSYIEDIWSDRNELYAFSAPYTHGADKSEELKTIKSKTLAPKVVRRF